MSGEAEPPRFFSAGATPPSAAASAAAPHQRSLSVSTSSASWAPDASPQEPRSASSSSVGLFSPSSQPSSSPLSRRLSRSGFSTPGSVFSSVESWCIDGQCTVDVDELQSQHVDAGDGAEDADSTRGSAASSAAGTPPRQRASAPVNQRWHVEAVHSEYGKFIVRIDLCKPRGQDEYYQVYALLPSQPPVLLNGHPLCVHSKWGWRLSPIKAALNALRINHQVESYTDPETKYVHPPQWVIFSESASSKKQRTAQFVVLSKHAKEEKQAKERLVSFENVKRLLHDAGSSSNKSVQSISHLLLRWMEDRSNKHVYVTAALHAVDNTGGKGNGFHRITVRAKLAASEERALNVAMHLDCTLLDAGVSKPENPVTVMGRAGSAQGVALNSISVWISRAPLTVYDLCQRLPAWLAEQRRVKAKAKLDADAKVREEHQARDRAGLAVFCVAKVIHVDEAVIHFEHQKWRKVMLDIGDNLAKCRLAMSRETGSPNTGSPRVAAAMASAAAAAAAATQPSAPAVASERLRTACVPESVEVRVEQLVVALLNARKGHVGPRKAAVVTDARVVLGVHRRKDHRSRMSTAKEALSVPPETAVGTELQFAQPLPPPANRQRNQYSRGQVKLLWSVMSIDESGYVRCVGCETPLQSAEHKKVRAPTLRGPSGCRVSDR